MMGQYDTIIIICEHINIINNNINNNIQYFNINNNQLLGKKERRTPRTVSLSGTYRVRILLLGVDGLTAR